MEETRIYKGNCHCGANRFEVRLPRIEAATSCRCSLCAKKGYLWVYPSPDAFKITRGGKETRTSYTSTFLRHEFCSKCGTGLTGVHHSDGTVAVNVRAILDINPFKLAVSESRVKESAVDKAPASTVKGEVKKLYTGSCHCGLVTVAVKSNPLPECEVKEDNCSICVRNAFIGIYPNKSEVTITGREKTVDYKFGRGLNGYPFCKRCGVHTFMNLYGPPKRMVDSWPRIKQQYVKKMLEVQPVNVRVLSGVELGNLKVAKTDEGTGGYALSD